MTIMSFRFLLLLTVCGIVLAKDSQPEEKVQRRGLCLGLDGCRHLPGAWRRRDTDAKREIQRLSPSTLRRRSWKDFWNGAAVAGTAVLFLGRRNTEAEKRKLSNYLPRPDVVDRDVIQKRVYTEDSATETERANHGGLKRDTNEDTHRALITRNNFAFANKKRRNERREEKVNWWHAAGGAALVGLAFLGRDADENVESKQERYIQERNHLVEPIADWLQKRDAYDGPEGALVTRNNFVSAKKEKRIEALMQK